MSDSSGGGGRGAGGIDDILRVDGADDLIVGGDEIVDGVGDLVGIGPDGKLYSFGGVPGGWPGRLSVTP